MTDDSRTARNGTCPQRDSAEHEEYAGGHRSFRQIWKERDNAEPELLEKILAKNNLVRAFKRVKANKGAPGVDGMTIEEAIPWLNENYKAMTDRIRKGKYTPEAGTPGRDSETRRRSTKAWYSDSS